MDILDLIDRLEELTAAARRLPVGGGVVISRQRLLDLVDGMRVALPREVYEAREIIDKREEVLMSAQDEVARLLSQAQAEVEARITETALVKAAEERARLVLTQAQYQVEELVKAAETQARERLDEAQEASRSQKRDADEYALQTMRRLERELEGFLSTVQRGIASLEQRSADRAG